MSGTRPHDRERPPFAAASLVVEPAGGSEDKRLALGENWWVLDNNTRMDRRTCAVIASAY